MKTYLKVASLCLFVVLSSCENKEECKYDVVPESCTLVANLNLSTGLDTAGNLLAPGKGVIDPFWKLINRPPLTSYTSPLLPSINGNAYVMNYNGNPWVGVTGASILAPADIGTTDTFGDNNANNSNGDTVPYIFERSFCVLRNTRVDFSFNGRADDIAFCELINNSTNTVVNTSPNFIITPATTWSVSALPLTAGSYSIRAYLSNVGAVILGFSLAGNLTTTNGDLAISNNVAGCCENNTISVLNILDQNCNSTFEAVDRVGNGYTFNLLNSTGTIIRTIIADINGNVFFTGLSDGTYSVQIVPQSGWQVNPPTSSQITVTVSNNEVEIVNFYNCKI